jgi:molybdopterin/thiamine biosynthesis adenylyltransferase
MLDIHVVGLGSLGSTMASEIAKRALALSLPLNLHLYDFDTVEERNVVAQLFDPKDIGASKVRAVSDRLNGYKGVKVIEHEGKITGDNVSSMPLCEESVILDCVDNLPTRQLLYTHSLVSGTPVLHAGMSTQGMGYVQWNYAFQDTFVDTWSLSPKNIKPSNNNEEEESRTVPPCELNSLRTLILNTSMAAINALFILVGHNTVTGLTSTELDPGTFTTWVTDIKGFKEIVELRSTM